MKQNEQMRKTADTLPEKSMEIDIDEKNTTEKKEICEKDLKVEFEDVGKEHVGRIIDERIWEDRTDQSDLAGGALGDLQKNVEEKEVESEHEIIEKKNNPVSHYWEDKDQCQPLVHPSDATSLGE